MTDTNILELQLYNTMSREKQVFQPIDPSRVTMYVCGPTVYNRVHIGNARPVVVFDTLYRVLKSVYPNVIYARNITDIDDKIMNAAAELGEDISVLSARYAEAYFEGFMNGPRHLIGKVWIIDRIRPLCPVVDHFVGGAFQRLHDRVFQFNSAVIGSNCNAVRLSTHKDAPSLHPRRTNGKRSLKKESLIPPSHREIR